MDITKATEAKLIKLKVKFCNFRSYKIKCLLMKLKTGLFICYAVQTVVMIFI